MGLLHSWQPRTPAWALLSTPGRLILLLVGAGKRLVSSILVLGPEAKVSLAVTEPLARVCC